MIFITVLIPGGVMDILICMILIFFLLVISIIKGIFIGYPLFIALIIFGILSIKKGFSVSDTLQMALKGGEKSLIVLQVFFLIGILTSMWISAGTIPAIVYYGIEFIDARLFLFYAFIITSGVSFLLGTAFGTVSTIGVALIVMAKSGDIDTALAAGAIISGAYFGDRCSPMSSSATLVANLTNTNLFTNIKKMFNTCIVPFSISSFIYAFLSLKDPMILQGVSIGKELESVFTISLWSFLPAIIILISSLLKVPVKRSMGISILTAFGLSYFIEGFSILDLLKFSIFGFSLPDGLIEGNILNKGGIISMAKAGVVVFISCSMAGIFNGTHLLDSLSSLYDRAQTRGELFIYTLITSVLTSIFGCNQTISIVLTEQLLKKNYSNSTHSSDLLAIDLENTSVVVPPLIPWNTAAYIATSTLGVGAYSYIPFTFYLYLLPIWMIVTINVRSIRIIGRLKPL